MLERRLVLDEQSLRNNDMLWTQKLHYAINHFEIFSKDFKLELRTKAIEEVQEHNNCSLEEATKYVDEEIADSIITFIQDQIVNTPDFEDNYDLLVMIKRGDFNEFINV